LRHNGLPCPCRGALQVETALTQFDIGAIEDRARCRHRLLKLLLRRGLAYPGQRPWKRGHDEWLRSIRFERAAEQAVFEDYRLAIIQVDERIKTLDEQLEKLACEEPCREPVGWLRCFHGSSRRARPTPRADGRPLAASPVAAAVAPRSRVSALRVSCGPGERSWPTCVKRPRADVLPNRKSGSPEDTDLERISLQGPRIKDLRDLFVIESGASRVHELSLC